MDANDCAVRPQSDYAMKFRGSSMVPVSALDATVSGEAK